MATLIRKKSKIYYSKISVRVGSRSLGKKKAVYIKLDTDLYSYAKKRNAIVSKEETKIRVEIKQGQTSKSDLLNINTLREWSWLKNDGSATSIKIHTLSEYIDKFIQFQKIKQRKESTINGYWYSLKKFRDALGSNVLISDINDEHIDIFIKYLEDRGLNLVSIDSNLRSVSAFMHWCQRRAYIDRIPTIDLFRPIIEDKWLTESEYNAILNFEYKPTANNYNLSLNYKRYAKVFKLYGETGMRLSEGFYGILSEDSNGIWLAIPNEHSKNKIGRTIELNEEQRDTIKMMQSIWYENNCTKSHIKYYSRMFRKVCNKLGVPKNKSFHSLRHYFGKTQITITGSIYKVSGMMGHSSTRVTEDSYVKGYDKKATLRDFPSLKKYLTTTENSQKHRGGIPNGVYSNLQFLES
jgi:integrase